jgi:TolA-binding protein
VEHYVPEALSHKVPFAYFMTGECYRKMDDMDNARAKWNELIAILVLF